MRVKSHVCSWCGYETQSWQAFEDHKVICENNNNITNLREDLNVIDYIEELDSVQQTEVLFDD